jgi:hypothetical protein
VSIFSNQLGFEFAIGLVPIYFVIFIFYQFITNVNIIIITYLFIIFIVPFNILVPMIYLQIKRILMPDFIHIFTMK